ncbi:hypothetical protein DL767_001122 [Monosporascus sp. MG133]|nr:hypothetical protein DL767_001122 [Monosporascus sp. MG133]
MFIIKQTRQIRRKHGREDARPPNLQSVYLLIAFVSIGALLFGYDQGVMGVIVADSRWIDLMKPANSWVTGAVVSLYDRGCLVGAVSIGILADIQDRERALSIACVAFIIGAVVQAAPYTITAIAVRRIAPAKLRRRIIGVEQMILCFGELVAFWLDYGFNYLETPHWWRIPLAIQVVPAVILAYGCWFWVPPSPRWLVQQDRHQCAREVLARLHGDAAAAVQMAAIADEVAFEKAVTTATWGDMFKTPVLRVTLLGMGVQFSQQITGTNSILYYTPSLFERGGIADPKTANLATGGVGIVLSVSA